MSEKEEKDVDEVEEEGERWRESSVTPVRRRQKKREELPAGWERHEVSWRIKYFLDLDIQVELSLCNVKDRCLLF